MKLLSTYIFLLISISSFSQFSVETELKYLTIIHKQGVIDLIDGNLKNAELTADSLIYRGQRAEINSKFFKELSISYFLTKEYELALFTLLEQRTLFPDPLVEKQSQLLFMESAYRCNLPDSLTKYLWNETLFISAPKNLTDGIEKCLELSVKLEKKELQKQIDKLGQELRNKIEIVPVWYQHWEFLTLIQMNEKYKNEILTYAKDNKAIYKQITNQKLQKKTYRKAIKHYIRSDSFVQARTVLKEYNERKLPLFLSFDSQIKKFRIWIKI